MTGTVNQTTNTVVIGNKSAFGTATFYSTGGAKLQAATDLTGANKINNNILFGGTGSLTLNNSGNNGIEFGGTVDLGGTSRSLTSAISGGATYDGVISNDGGLGFSILTQNSSVVTLKGTNTYTGNTTIFGTGKVSVSSIGNSGASGNLGAGTTINLGQNSAMVGSLVYTGTGETTSKKINLAGTTGGAVIDQSGTGLLKFTGVNTTTGSGSKTLTLQGSTAGNGEIAGAIVDNTAINKTSLVKAGTNTWTLSGANTYTGSTTVNGGTLSLNFDSATAPATNIISSSSSLAIGGAAFTVTGKSSTATTQTVNGLTLNSGASNISVFQAATPNAVVLNLGSITRNPGATVNFTLPPGGQNSGYGITTSATAPNGMIGGYATVGLNDWASLSGTNIVPIASYFVKDQVSQWISSGAGSTSNMTDSNGYDATFTTSITLNSLRFNSGTSDSNLGVVSNNNLTLGSGGLLVSNNVGTFYQRIGFLNTSFTTGQGQGGLTLPGAGDLIINENNSGSGHLEIYSTIFGTGVNLVKSGAGFLDLKGLAASYTGSTTINAGTLQLSGGTDMLPTATSVTMNGGTLTLNGVDQSVAGLTGSTLSTVDHVGANSTLTVNQASGTNTFSGVIKNTSGTLGLTKSGAGTMVLAGTAANTATGLTTVAAGELDLSKTAGVNAIAGDASTSSNDVSVTGGTLKWLANDQVGDTATITVNGGTVNLNGKTETLGSLIVNSGTFQTGAGHLTGTTATVQFAGGTSTINSGGIVEDGHIVVTGGTNTVQGGGTEGLLHLLSGGLGLQITGASITLNSDATNPGRLLLDGNVSSATSSTTAFITSGGSAANAGAVDLGTGTRTFTAATGTTPSGIDLSISAKIIAPGGGLTKAGTGTLELTGANTYAGGTVVNSGTLLADNSSGSATGSGGVMVNANGTLGGIGSINAGSNNININANGIITGAKNGSVGALTLTAANVIFAGTDASNVATYAVDILSNTSDRLNITGVLDLSSGFDRIAFNGTPDGTSSYVLATYTSATGTFDSFPTLPTGYQLIYGSTELDLTPIPEPGTWAMGALVSVGLLATYRARRNVSRTGQ